MPENFPGNGYRDPDSFDVRGSLRSLGDATRQHKLLVLMSCVLSLALTALYVHLFPPIYLVTARVMVEKAVDNSRDAFYNLWDAFRKDDPRTEIELVTAPNMLAEVVKKDGLKYDDVYHPFLSHLSYLWVKSLPGRTYHRVKEFFFPKEPDPDAPSAADIEFAKTVMDMKSGISMVPVVDSDVGELTVKGPSRRVAKTANTLLEIYMTRRAERYRMEAQRNLDALDKEVDLAAKEAQDVASSRLAFAQANGLTFDLTKESQQLTKMVDLEDSIATNQAKAASLAASLQLVEKRLSQEPVTKTSSIIQELNAVREATRLKRLDLESQLISVRSVYREDSPEVQDVLRSIAALDTLIAGEPEKLEKGSTSTLNSIHQDLTLSADNLRSQLVGVEAGTAVMQATDRKLRARMSTVPELQNAMRDFDRKYALVLQRYEALSAKRAQAAVSRAMAGAAMPSMQVVQWASAPDGPWWPKLKLLYASALAVGLILGVLGAQIRSLMSGRVRRGDLERGRADVPLYGTVRISIGSQPFSVAGKRRPAGLRNES
jgi:uncharacterized protein involved in exopolysaccharide biosynthesis